MEQIIAIAQQFMGHDQEAAVSKAAQENPEDEKYYRDASRHVANHPEQHHPPTDDEAEAAKTAHHEIYKKHNTTDLQSMGADAVGGAIATQAIQSFLGSGGGDTNDLLAFAMKEGTQLLGGADPDFKGVVMQKAAMMVFKSQLSGGGGGGAMSLLQKFL